MTHIHPELLMSLPPPFNIKFTPLDELHSEYILTVLNKLAKLITIVKFRISKATKDITKVIKLYI